MRLGILGSGKGSNFRALVEAARKNSLTYEPVLVISDVPSAGILSVAKEFNIPAKFIDPGSYKSKLCEKAEQEVIFELQAARVDFIALAGFMRVIKEPLLNAFPEKIINIHPSLLPAFPGLEAWRQALEANVPETGCTVHYVDAGIDSGKILGQLCVPVLPGDTAERLHARIQEAEHELYPLIVEEVAKKFALTPHETF
ncbi:MAG: phosphoribosylglycinamide formyltransferase [Chthoniobacterales bacterium]